MLKIIYTVLTLLVFNGCGVKKSYILENQEILLGTQSFKYSIGIKTIDLPQYLLHKEIPILKNRNEIVYLKNREWGAYLDEHLTNRIVSTLQRSFNSPNIYKYPLNSLTNPDIIIYITIHKFIANTNHVVLEASWQQSGFNQTKTQRFSTKIPIKSQEDIVEGMNKAFGALESKLIQNLLDGELANPITTP